MGSISSKDMIFRADMIDLKTLDMQLEKHLSRVWSKSIENQRPKDVWEIDLSKLEIIRLVAQGTYGTVYRGTYDNQDVAGKHPLYFIFLLLVLLLLRFGDVKELIGKLLSLILFFVDAKTCFLYFRTQELLNGH